MRREHLPIVSPCHEDWSEMTGDEQRRHCWSCARDVLHLSAMTAEAARAALLARRGERVCVRYACDADDNLVFAAPRSGPLRAVVVASALAACTASELPRELAIDPVEAAERCETGEPPSVEDEPVRYEDELVPGPPERPAPVTEVLVEAVELIDAAPVRAVHSSQITMGVPASMSVERAPLPMVALKPTIAGASPPPPRVLPIETLMGAMGLEISHFGAGLEGGSI